jgi:hypothetical protein
VEVEVAAAAEAGVVVVAEEGLVALYPGLNR